MEEDARQPRRMCSGHRRCALKIAGDCSHDACFVNHDDDVDQPKNADPAVHAAHDIALLALDTNVALRALFVVHLFSAAARHALRRLCPRRFLRAAVLRRRKQRNTAKHALPRSSNAALHSRFAPQAPSARLLTRSACRPLYGIPPRPRPPAVSAHDAIRRAFRNRGTRARCAPPLLRLTQRHTSTHALPRFKCARPWPSLTPLTATGSRAVFHTLTPSISRALRATSLSSSPPSVYSPPALQPPTSPRSRTARAPLPANCASEPPPLHAMPPRIIENARTPRRYLHDVPAA
ncbi:hypothetical protein HYPSUDRAFT_201449 [Hypholoma sublateritium FD-334 SS-4]|uniref:Uncharacterized protein n=1 Tax=Hypholoma sublateritium (strain FD-334 SS-4) TaxID=945553 RepID=A0A0D2NXB3_HYPSF|nr:hypothetical protein HYPSUDRAFT_201449 [Hypholoma sublateritium FD-334 SS-4]